MADLSYLLLAAVFAALLAGLVAGCDALGERK
jgi:hypothetical protein